MQPDYKPFMFGIMFGIILGYAAATIPLGLL